MEQRRFHGEANDGQRLFDDAAVARQFQRRLREARPQGGYARAPVLYDESGYPLEDRTSLTDRVRRLITG
jgi:hypothetical protein